MKPSLPTSQPPNLTPSGAPGFHPPLLAHLGPNRSPSPSKMELGFWIVVLSRPPGLCTCSFLCPDHPSSHVDGTLPFMLQNSCSFYDVPRAVPPTPPHPALCAGPAIKSRPTQEGMPVWVNSACRDRRLCPPRSARPELCWGTPTSSTGPSRPLMSTE